VAYLTDGKPVQGKAEIEPLWHKLRWRFASSEHREMFAKDPDHYAPQYGGYCAMGMSNDDAAHKDTVDPELGPSSTASFIWCTTNIGWGYGETTPRNTSSELTPAGELLRTGQNLPSWGLPALLPRRQPRLRY
jgi:hypothetical protein